MHVVCGMMICVGVTVHVVCGMMICVGVTVHVVCGMMIKPKKDGFLSSKANKQRCLKNMVPKVIVLHVLVVRCNHSRVWICKRFGSKEDKERLPMVFSQEGQAKQDIIVAGKRALVSLYWG